MLSFFFAFGGGEKASAQGRVVINEYMPWTLNGCGATAEFVELLNFGPGPINIGCYILTDGDFSVTIPPNTILQPGEFYVIAGQDVIPAPCANIDSTITADLNWNTCGCTSDPIPTTGDGFFTDGGSANEQVVLLDPALNVVDAVVRDLPTESSGIIATAPMAGCPSQVFNLASMSINYETLGMSTGRGNSFARTRDGDCGWVKDPQQSGNATNNRDGDISDIYYELTITNAMDCNATRGSIDIYVKHHDYSTIFPMSYTLAFDSNNDGVFDFSDQYTTGTDSTEPNISISGLPSGNYRVTVASSKGCYLETFVFSILPCYAVLPVKLKYFRAGSAQNGRQKLEWALDNAEQLRSVTLEKSTDRTRFVTSQVFTAAEGQTGEARFRTEEAVTEYRYFRLKIIAKDGSVTYSPLLTTIGTDSKVPDRVGPNPARDHLNLQITACGQQSAPYTITTAAGAVARKGVLALHSGLNIQTLSLQGLPSGTYLLQVALNTSAHQPISFRFVKQ